MKKFASYLTVAVLWVLIGVVPAMAITYSEVATGTTDPTIGAVNFFAGSGSAFNDTITDDSWTPGNPYLMSGRSDGANPALWDDIYFLGASLNTPGYIFNTISFDVAVEEILPGTDSAIGYGFYNNGGGGFIHQQHVNNSDYIHYSFTNTDLAYFGIFSSDILNDGYTASPFHIDNFTYTTKLIDPGTNAVPEPSTIILLGLGLAGCAAWRKRRQ